MKGPGFAYFNAVTNTIYVQLSEDRELEDVGWNDHPQIYLNHNEELEPHFRDLTEEELDLVGLEVPVIYVRSYACLDPGSSDAIQFTAPNGKHFTVQDLLDMVIECERQTRGKTHWFGGIDRHHVFFEGMSLREDGTWVTHWGS